MPAGSRWVFGSLKNLLKPLGLPSRPLVCATTTPPFRLFQPRMPKSVCIVGAGPSGLVAAKTLLQNVPTGTFSVTIFEAQNRIGGLWPTKKTDENGLIHPMMIANQSRHTVQFSDMAWAESDPEMPKAWQIGQYLERYAQKYAAGADIRLGHKVVGTELKEGGKWHVRTEATADGTESSHLFDYLLISTGFFGQPAWPANIPKDADVPIVHSSKYRNLKGLLANSKGHGSKILVVGGQMSGIEISGTIATHLSSATHSPGEKVIPTPEKYSIHHVVQKPSWIFPLFTSPDPRTASPPFLPCDLPSYNLTKRPKPLTNTQGHITVEAARLFNGIYKSVLGTDQAEFSPQLKVDGEALDEQPYLAMSSHYTDFVRSGLINLSKGKLDSISGTTAMLSNGETINDVAAVVLATGFDPAPSLSFLPTSVLESIAYSPAHPSLPAALAFHGTHDPSLPTLGFVGFYRSPYWGVMEMQARFVSALWSKAPGSSAQLSISPTAMQKALLDDDSISRTLALREDSRTSQFPMGDYAYLMQEFARALDMDLIPFNDTEVVPRIPSDGLPMDILTPARYLSSGATEDQKAEAAESRRLTHSTAINGLTKGRFVAGAVFRSLLGKWRLERDLFSRHPALPSGRFVGTAQFLLRKKTSDGLPTEVDEDEEGDSALEYLYVEDGDFAADNGMTFRATRRYVWRYDEAADQLSVWFVRTDDALRADYLFHDVEFEVPEPGSSSSAEKSWGGEKGGWYAKASHLCIQDLYNVQYRFRFNSVNLKDWRIGYTVKGPKKDYTIDGVYRRLT